MTITDPATPVVPATQDATPSKKMDLPVSPKGSVQVSPPTDEAAPTETTLATNTSTTNTNVDEECDETDTLGPFADPSSTYDRDRSRSRHRDYLPLPDGSNPRQSLPRSRSVISFRALNDSVDRIVNDIRIKFRAYRSGRRDRLLHDVPHLNQIYYSVFKSPLDLHTPFLMPPEGCAATGPVSQAQFDSIVDSVIEAMEAGVPPKLISQGSSGSYFMYDPSGKIVGVFKPKDEEPYGPLSPKWTKWLHRNLFPCFFGRPCLVPNNGYICEAGASLLDRQLQTHIVPFTDIVYLSSPAFYYRFWDRRRHYVKGRPLPNKVGSFQLFLHGYQQADVFLKNHPLPDDNRRGSWTPPMRVKKNLGNDHGFEWTPEVLQQFREEVEKLVILDYIMRNTDRGLDNWMIRVEWETVPDPDLIDMNNTTQQHRFKKVPRIKIGAIDSGLAFPWKHPDEWRSYPFGWLFLPLSVIGKPFSEKTRKHFLPMLCSSEWWEESAVAMRHLFSQDSEFKERLWKKQWAVMKGQAFNVVETLKCPEQGPLELVRRTRVMVWDDEMDVPVHVPYLNTTMSMDGHPAWQRSGSLRDTESVASYHDDDGDGDDERRGKFKHNNQSYTDNTGEVEQQPSTQHPPPATRNKSADARLMVPYKKKGSGRRGRRSKGSALNLEARYHALESSETLDGSNDNKIDDGGTSGRKLVAGRAKSASRTDNNHNRRQNLNLFDELISNASEHKHATAVAAAAASHGPFSDGEADFGENSGDHPQCDAGVDAYDGFEVGDEDEDDDTDRHTISCSNDVPVSYRNQPNLINNVGFSIVEGYQATRRVIVERLQTVTSKPPVFTWC